MIISRIKDLAKKILKQFKPAPYDFDRSNPLGGGGERVDFTYKNKLDISKLDMYQLSHYRRYEFACKTIVPDQVCGDFACGTGYGTVMLAQISKKALGADINGEVINTITERYRHITNVRFVHANLLDLEFEKEFDNIVSFETIEHFKEDDIHSLLALYAKALKPGGKLIISTPYMQEKDEAALRLGYHLTFYIDEAKINDWLKQWGFGSVKHYYQNYSTHTIEPQLAQKDFIITVAERSA